MIVCICRRVSDHAIAHAARSGCASFEELQSQLGVATACGACRGCAQDTFDAHRVGGSGGGGGGHQQASTLSRSAQAGCSVVMLPRRGRAPAASA
jgi:bacterioferritin-associated ferredoxin